MKDMQADYRNMLADLGETIIIRRNNPSPAAPTEVTVRARVAGYQPQDLVGGIKQGDRRVIVLALDLDASGFPLPLKTGGTDKAVVRGRVLNIGVVDDSTRRVGGELLAYEITATG